MTYQTYKKMYRTLLVWCIYIKKYILPQILLPTDVHVAANFVGCVVAMLLGPDCPQLQGGT
jgi:hypothetical protein